MEISARGTRVRAVLNGVVVRDWDGAGVLDDAAHRERNVGLRGHLALQGCQPARTGRHELLSYEKPPRGNTPAELTAPAASPGGSTDTHPFIDALPFADPEESFRAWMDFSLLPDFEKVSKYFHFSVWAGSANAEGISFKFFSPTPTGAKP